MQLAWERTSEDGPHVRSWRCEAGFRAVVGGGQREKRRSMGERSEKMEVNWDEICGEGKLFISNELPIRA